MKTVAIVEDSDDEFEAIKEHLERFSEESGGMHEFECVRFRDAVNFLQGYKPIYDMIFMDIGLPGINGFEATKKLREIDSTVLLIFVTNMSRFAVSGYEVGAFDFVVKPVKYGSLRLKLIRALERLSATEDKKIKIPSGGSTRYISVSAIKYVEVMNHSIVFHTTDGDIESYGSLKKIEDMLPPRNFAKCNSCYLVNLKYVTAVRDFTAVVGDALIAISHAKKKDFMRALNTYMEGTA